MTQILKPDLGHTREDLCHTSVGSIIILFDIRHIDSQVSVRTREGKWALGVVFITRELQDITSHLDNVVRVEITAVQLHSSVPTELRERAFTAVRARLGQADWDQWSTLGLRLRVEFTATLNLERCGFQLKKSMLKCLARLGIPRKRVRLVVGNPVTFDPHKRNDSSTKLDARAKGVLRREKDTQKHRNDLEPDFRSNGVLLYYLLAVLLRLGTLRKFPQASSRLRERASENAHTADEVKTHFSKTPAVG